MIGKYYTRINKLALASEIVKNEDPSKPLTKFSIVIPFRNEAERLLGLLQSLANLNYAKDCFEILLVDDDSKDTSIQVIESFIRENLLLQILVLKNIRSSKSPKKDAITTAISAAKNEWIVTTDADCELPTTWLSSFHHYLSNNQKEFIVGPLVYKSSKSFIDQYQLLDNLSLQGITMGSFGNGKGLLCNGANLAYTKTLFRSLNGFNNNNKIASGDDIFMLENAQSKFPEKVGYLANKGAIVSTFPEKSWKAIISQRLRWAKKTGSQKNKSAKILGLVVFATNLSIVLLPILILLLGLNIWLGLLALGLKIFIDYLLLHKTGRFFGRHISAVKVMSHVYVYALVSCWVVLKSMFTNYTWKERSHSQ